MNCIPLLILCSVFWSTSPLLYKKAGNIYNNDHKKIMNAILTGLFGLIIGGCGTGLFIYSTTICKDLSSSVMYTYSIPIIISTIGSIMFYKEKMTFNKIIALLLILSGLYLIKQN